MKIAIDIRSAGGEKTGKGWYTFYIVQNLIRLDRENEYILYAKDGIPGFDHFKNAKLKLINSHSIFWHRKVANDVVKEEAEIFFAPNSYIIPALLPSYIKSIITVHDLVAFLFCKTHNKRSTLIEKLFLKSALKKARRILTVSEHTKLDLLERFKKVDRDKVDTIYCAASEEFQPISRADLVNFAKETNLPEKFFLAVGTLEPRKNYPNLITAFHQVSEKFPDHHLIIVGQKGWAYEEIYEKTFPFHLGKKVHLLGYLSNRSLVKLYNLAKALVFSSFYEGFGMPPLEAMQSGCPVICSNTSSLPEVVGDSALLVNPESHFEIAGAMMKLIKDENLGRILRQKGLNQAQKFSWKTSAEKLLAIINGMQG